MPIVVVIFCLLLLIGQQPELVSADQFDERLADVMRRHSGELDARFEKCLKLMFYDQERLSLQTQNYALMAVSAKMSESVAILYAFQRRAMIVATEVVDKYFIAKSIPLDRSLILHPTLIDIVFLCTSVRSSKHGLVAIGQHRRSIHLLEKAHEREPGVVDLASMYGSFFAKLEHKKLEAKQSIERALATYTEAVPSVISLGNAANTLRVIGEMIRDTERRLDQADRSSIERLLRRYVDPKTVADITVALEKTDMIVEQFAPNEVQAVRMEDIEVYDRAVIQSRISGVPTHLSYQYQVRDTSKESYRKFQQTMHKLFDRWQEVARRTENFALMALSAQMAETEALMCKQELSMLQILDDLFERNALTIDRFLATNRKPFDALVQRLMNFALNDGLRMVDQSRKMIYLIEKENDRRQGVKELARDYASSIYSRKSRLIKCEFDAKQLVDSIRLETTRPEEAEGVLSKIEDMYNQAIENYRRSDSNMRDLLREFIESPVHDAIQQAKRNSISSYTSPSLADTLRVTDQDIYNYEYSLFAPNERPGELADT